MRCRVRGSARNRAGIPPRMRALSDAGFSADGRTIGGPDRAAVAFSIPCCPKGQQRKYAIAELLYFRLWPVWGSLPVWMRWMMRNFVARNAAFDFDMRYLSPRPVAEPGQ